MSIVSETLIQNLPAKRKTTPTGWTSFNAPCCPHNGQTPDHRQRGGVIVENEVISYHCFNCGFTASWQPGRPLSQKMRKLLQWLGTPDNVITNLVFEVMRLNEGVEATKFSVTLPEFEPVELPPDSHSIYDIAENNKWYNQAIEYIGKRKLPIDEANQYYWNSSLAYRDRLIVPFTYQNKIVGWTARTTQADKKPKYLSSVQPGYVYGLDQQTDNKIFVILVEGVFDAIQLDGCAMLGAELSDAQALLINQLKRDVIVLPDRDKTGSGIVERALELGYSVSMPDWHDDIKDASDAVLRYGRIYTLYSVVNSAESSPLKIKLKAKKWFG